MVVVTREKRANFLLIKDCSLKITIDKFFYLWELQFNLSKPSQMSFMLCNAVAG